MGKTKELLEELYNSKEANKHGLDDDHWQYVIELAEAVAEAEQAYKVKLKEVHHG